MANDILVGSTGFVGGNLAACHTFAAACHSTDVHTAFDTPHSLVVYAGVPSAMFLANQDPQADLEVMRQARQNLRRLMPDKRHSRILPRVQGWSERLKKLCSMPANSEFLSDR